MAKRGIRLTAEQVTDIRKAIAAGMERKDVVKTFGISYATYNKYAPKTSKNHEKAGNGNRVNQIAGAVKLIAEVVEAVKVIVKDSENIKAENAALKTSLRYANAELKKYLDNENQRIALKIESENSVQSLEARD